MHDATKEPSLTSQSKINLVSNFLEEIAQYESTITPEEIEQMKAFLKEHPVDPQYDGLLDGDIPTEQAHAQIYTSILKDLGELPE